MELYFIFFFDILIEAYTEINTINTVSKSMTRAVTIKKGEAPSDYRPLTLINIDYKILTKYFPRLLTKIFSRI